MPVEAGGTDLYNEGSGAVLGGGAVSAAGLAATGFNAMAFAVIGFTLVLLGLLLVRSMAVRVGPDACDAPTGVGDGVEPRTHRTTAP